MYGFCGGDPVNGRDPSGDCNPFNAKCRAEILHAAETAAMYAQEIQHAVESTVGQATTGLIEGIANFATAGQYSGVKQAIQKGHVHVPHSLNDAVQVARNINDARLHGIGQFVTGGTLDRSLRYLQEEGGSGWKQPFVAVDEQIGYSEMDAGVQHMLAGDAMGGAEFVGGLSKLTGTAATVLGGAELIDANKSVTMYHATDADGVTSIRANGIDLSYSRAQTDFSRGFYVTHDYAQAVQWAGADGQVLAGPGFPQRISSAQWIEICRRQSGVGGVRSRKQNGCSTPWL